MSLDWEMATQLSNEKLAHIWRNDITGLRALAVLPVIFYHAFPSLLPGGFFGVDIFFVISGYLISGIIFRNVKAGKFSYSEFYVKRIKRIIPNLILVLLFALIAGYFILFADDYNNLGRHVYSSAVFIENFRLLSEIGYFTEDAVRKPLLHLWSLAIEEQFYIVFPIICVLIWRFCQSVRLLGFFVFALTLASLLACLLCVDKSFAFYFPLTRFWELGGGIVLSYFETFQILETRRIARSVRHFLSVVGLVIILVPMFMYAPSWSHPGFVTVLPVLGAILLLLSHPDALVNRSLLAWSPMIFIGLISYSLYLWHWPLLSFLSICIPNPPVLFSLGAVALSFLLAVTVYYFVENPVRRSNFALTFSLKRFSFKVSVPLILMTLVLVEASAGYMLRKTEGLPNRSINHEFPELVKIRQGVSWSKEPRIVIDGINVYGLSEGVPEIVFAGDSHAVQYYYRMKRLAHETGISAGMLESSGCFILAGGDKQVCQQASESFYKLISRKEIKKVVVVNKWGSRYDQVYFDEGISRIRNLLTERKDLKLYILLDPPWDEGVGGAQGNFDPLRHFNRFNPQSHKYFVTYSNDASWKLGNDAIVEALADVAEIIDSETHVCPDGKCDVLKWYMDDDHLQPRRLETEGYWIDRIFK